MKFFTFAILSLTLVGCAGNYYPFPDANPKTVPAAATVEKQTMINLDPTVETTLTIDGQKVTGHLSGTLSVNTSQQDAGSVWLADRNAQRQMIVEIERARASADPCRSWWLAPSYCYDNGGYNGGGYGYTPYTGNRSGGVNVVTYGGSSGPTTQPSQNSGGTNTTWRR